MIRNDESYDKDKKLMYKLNESGLLPTKYRIWSRK